MFWGILGAFLGRVGGVLLVFKGFEWVWALLLETFLRGRVGVGRGVIPGGMPAHLKLRGQGICVASFCFAPFQ